MAVRVAWSRNGDGRFLDELLMPALDRALALPEVDEVAVGVAEHLDLDVPRLFHEFFDEDPVVAEGCLGLGAAGQESFRSFLSLRATRRPRPPPPAEALIITG